ncbi:MAG: cytochrome c [Caldilineaceae bacterium]|nr:cytochrome c [Caldilineaceae bacterium]
MFNRKTLLTVLFILLLALAGCGRNDPEPTATPAPAKPTEAAAPAVVGDAAAGEAVYMGTCVACHGPDAKGVAGLGKSLHASDSDFIKGKTDDELVAFIMAGRTPDDPLNTTGVGMPAKGGNPAITEQQLHDVVVYIRTLE